jgi:hypothetical protein
MTHALVQKLPPEAWDLETDRYGVVSVLATGSELQMEAFREDYRRRLDVACDEWDAWEDQSKDWDASFDVKHDELCRKYAVCWLTKDVELEILPVGVDV